MEIEYANYALVSQKLKMIETAFLVLNRLKLRIIFVTIKVEQDLVWCHITLNYIYLISQCQGTLSDKNSSDKIFVEHNFS